MKIIRTIETFYPYISGPANQAYKISEELEKQGIRSPIMTTFYGAKGRPAQEKMGFVSVHRYPHRMGFMKYLYSPAMKRALKGFDIIHTHNYRSYQAEISYLAARKHNKPFVLSTHGSLLGYKSFVRGINQTPYLVYDVFGRTVVDNADAVIVSSKMEYAEAREFGVSKDKLHIIPMGIDINDYTPMEKTWKGTRLLFVGRISRDRRLEPIIEAMPMIKDAHLTIVGAEAKRSSVSKPGYIEELKRLSNRLGIRSRVYFAGEKHGEELRYYYRSSDVFVYTSVWENFGQSLLEAQAAGLPLVCTPVGIAPEVVIEKTGRILDGLTPNDIKAAIKQVKSLDKDFIRKRIVSIYGWEGITKKYLKLYKGLN